MQDWKVIFSSYLNSGVYYVEKSSNARLIRKAASTNGLDHTFIDLKKSHDKNSFLKTVADALKFPSYFGMNWDALNDSLTDMSWKLAAGQVIVFTNFNSIFENMAAEVEIIRNIFDSSTQHWRQRKVQFYIVIFE